MEEKIYSSLNYLTPLFLWYKPVLGLALTVLLLKDYFKNKREISLKKVKILFISIFLFTIISVIFWVALSFFYFKLPNNFFGEIALKDPDYMKELVFYHVNTYFMYDFFAMVVSALFLFIFHKRNNKIIALTEIYLFSILALMLGWQINVVFILISLLLMVFSHLFFLIRKIEVKRLSIYPYFLIVGILCFLYIFIRNLFIV